MREVDVGDLSELQSPYSVPNRVSNCTGKRHINFDRIEKINQAAKKNCPVIHRRKLKQLFTPVQGHSLYIDP